MTDSAAEPAVSNAPLRRKCAWWQWAIGLGLIGYAVFSLLVRGVARHRPDWFAGEQTYDPIPIKIMDGLKSGDRIPAKSGDFAGHNILLITLDTTRADHIGCYGNSAIQTPVMDRLAKQGILFSRAYAPNPTTLPSHSSMMTGLNPFRHGARANGMFRLGDQNLTLAEILLAQEYATGAAISAFVLDSRYGLAQGFSDYDDKILHAVDASNMRDPERSGKETTDRAIGWLEAHAGQSPFFYWIHYFDPHQPYEPKDQYSVDYASMPYDGEIAYVDNQIARLLELLEKKGVGDKTIVVVVGDHGQGLGEHDESTHGFLVYESTLHVPLIVACGNRLGGGLHINSTVSVADIFPTLLSLLGLEKPHDLDALDLTAPLPPDRKLYFDTLEGLMGYGLAAPLCVREGNYKFIHLPKPELYDLDGDPHELNNIYADKADVATSLLTHLKGYYGDDLTKAVNEETTLVMTEEELRQLRALGYIGEGISSVPQSGDLPDPKDMMPIVHRAEAALAGLAMGNPQQSIEALEAVVAEYPKFYVGYKYLVECFLKQEDLESARETLKRCVDIHPNVPYPYVVLARLGIHFKDFEEAMFWHEQALKVAPDHFTALSELGGLLLELNKDAPRAAELLLAAYKVRPDDQNVVEHMGAAMNKAGRSSEILGVLTEQLKAKPHLAATRNALGRLLLQSKQCEECIRILREGVALDPNQDELVNNLAFAIIRCTETGSLPPLEAIILIEKLCRKTNYKVPEYMRSLAFVYGGFARYDEAISVCERAKALAIEKERPELVMLFDGMMNQFRIEKAKHETVGATSQPGTTTSPDSADLPPSSGVP